MNSNQNGQDNKSTVNTPNNLPTNTAQFQSPAQKQTNYTPPNYQFKTNTTQSSTAKAQETTNENSQPNNEQESKERTARWLAILGFLAVIAALAWIVILVVGTFVPNLASILSINFNQTQNEPTITLTSRAINHNEDFTLNWDNVARGTTVQFSYDCEDGVSFETNTGDRGIQSIQCSIPYNFDSGTNEITLTARSTQARFSDVPVSVSFIPGNDSNDTVIRSTVVSITNSRISLTDTDTVTDSDNTIPEDEITTTPDEQTVSTPPTTEQTTPQPPTASPTPSQPQYQYVYTIPQSDPNGFTDLGVRYLGVGKIESGNFTPLTKFDQGENGAIRFAIKNNGTRTSETWTYRAVLPNGQVYQSPNQSPLRPNEEATIALGFKAPEEVGTNVFKVTISTTRDTNNSNNLIRWTVQTR